MKTIKVKPFIIEYDDQNKYGTDWTVKREGEVVCKFIFTTPDEVKSTDMTITVIKELTAKEYKKILEYVIDINQSGEDGVVFIRTEKLPEGELASALREVHFVDDIDGEPDITNITHIVYEHELVSWMALYMSLGLALGLMFNHVWGMCIGMCIGLCIGSGLDASYKPKREELKKKRKQLLTGRVDDADTSSQESSQESEE